MNKGRALFFGGIACIFFAACADDLPDLPTGNEQQLNRPATLGNPSDAVAPPPADPFNGPARTNSLGNPTPVPAPTIPGER